MTVPTSSPTSPSTSAEEPASAEERAIALMNALTIGSQDWHRLKGNRRARALEQTAAALVYLLKDQPEEALLRLQQATGWLDRSIKAPPCPTHGHHGAVADQTPQP